LARNKNKLTVISTFAAIALIGFGLWGYLQQYRATNNPNPAIPVEVVRHSTDNPDETKPICDESYQVEPNKPRKIEIPSLNVSGCIQQVGVDENNNIAVPTNIHVAGWFVDSVLPGEAGVSIIDGHVQGRYEEAIFKQLVNLKAGDQIIIEYGNRDIRTFEVVSNSNHTIEQTASEQFIQLEDVDKQLTLITCGGNYDQALGEFDERIVVRSKLIER
jgi:LPXTG-site transpeptidase (sortase) family protein